jgi:hypothetical protein
VYDRGRTYGNCEVKGAGVEGRGLKVELPNPKNGDWVGFRRVLDSIADEFPDEGYVKIPGLL